MTSNAKWLSLYALIAVLALLAAITVLIVSGHDTNVLIGAIIALVPVVTGIGALMKGQQQIVTNTNGNVTALSNALVEAHNLLKQSVPASQVSITAPAPGPEAVIPPPLPASARPSDPSPPQGGTA